MRPPHLSAFLHKHSTLLASFCFSSWMDSQIVCLPFAFSEQRRVVSHPFSQKVSQILEGRKGEGGMSDWHLDGNQSFLRRRPISLEGFPNLGLWDPIGKRVSCTIQSSFLEHQTGAELGRFDTAGNITLPFVHILHTELTIKTGSGECGFGEYISGNHQLITSFGICFDRTVSLTRNIENSYGQPLKENKS